MHPVVLFSYSKSVFFSFSFLFFGGGCFLHVYACELFIMNLY